VAAQWGEFVALAHAVEQEAVDLGLQCLDAAAQGRLGEVQLFGRAAEGAGFGDGQEVLEVANVHRGRPGIWMKFTNDYPENNALDTSKPGS